MSGFVVYSCHCLNIRIHLSTKYTIDNLSDFKSQTSVKEPTPGWEFDLGMGGIVTVKNQELYYDNSLLTNVVRL